MPALFSINRCVKHPSLKFPKATLRRSIKLLPNLIEDLLPRLKLLIPLRHLVRILIHQHTDHIPPPTQPHLPLPNHLSPVVPHIHDPWPRRCRFFGIFVNTHAEVSVRSEEESRVRRERVPKGAFGVLERLHGGLHVVVNEQDGAFGENVIRDGAVEGEGDLVGGELDVGGTDKDVVDAEVVGGAVEVEWHTGGGVAGVAEAPFEGTVFDDADKGDEDVGRYCLFECRRY